MLLQIPPPNIQTPFCSPQLDNFPCPSKPPYDMTRVEKAMPFKTLQYLVFSAFSKCVPFRALPNPNMIWYSIEGHALPDTAICCSVWKGMPFYALPYHIGVRKGMEGHWEGIGHKLEESLLFYAHVTWLK